ncbi:DNA-binding protein [Histidinibacterium aquaticum]|uniref:DNA-binding protein n=1 Tax=Histidinibacterium aquaticum TaxID=2613962 RepID=A0A5J5GLM9_9RHOB|nr:DNA-binding protein [Histidinibacterium aquaticum]
MWPAAETRHLALRLAPGEDLRTALEHRMAESGATAGVVLAAVGSLTRASLRFAGRDDAAEVAGPLEILSLSGTLSPDGPHLHLSVADGTGAMRGGHLLPGCEIRTTAEIVLGLTSAVRFARRLDPATGYPELQVLAP